MDVYTVSGVGPASLTMRRLPLDADNLKQEVQQMDENKIKALAAALSQIEKQFGKGSIMRLGESEISKDIEVVSTGSLGLDLALGIGGLPRGRVVEIYGPESSGKTTLTLSVIAESRDRRRDGRAADGPPGAAHVAGPAEAHREYQALEHAGHFHQPDPDEDRRHVRQSRDDDRRQCAQVLRFCPHRHPARRLDQE